MSIQDMEDLKQQYLDEMKTLINEKDYRSGRIDIEIKINELKENFNEMSIEINKKKKLQQLKQEYTIAITPEKPVDSLIMEDEHLDTIPETKSDEFIKSSVENLVPTPSESEDFSNIELMTSQVMRSEFNPIHNEYLDSTPKDVRFDVESYLLESLVNHDTLMASPPKIDFLLDEFAAFQDNSNTIIESLPTFPIPLEDSDSLREEIDIFSGPDDSIPPGIESDDFDSEDDNNSTSLPEFDSFHVDYPDSGDSTIDVVEDIPVDVPNILPTYPTLHMDFDFNPSNDLGSDHDVSSPSGNRNKIYDPGICIEVESTRFLATLSPVIDTLLPFSSENEDKVFNHGVLASKEKSPPSSSHRGFKASKLFHQKSPMLIHGDSTPNLGVRHLHFYPP
ncbi:hypothetical protein Tco_0216257 [Tanacetum coccineum]